MQILQSLRLTDNQKTVLATIMKAQSPQLAAEALSGDQNLIAAGKILARVGLVDINNDQASVTDKGIQVMKDSGMVDDSGQLTGDGEGFARGNQQQDQSSPPTDQFGGDVGFGGIGGMPGGDIGSFGDIPPGDDMFGDESQDDQQFGDQQDDSNPLTQQPEVPDQEQQGEQQTMTADKSKSPNMESYRLLQTMVL